MIGQGMHHIADGYDHVLFLAVLLLSAPLVAKRTAAGWRWSPRADNHGSSVRRILTIVTAFTVGHSITLLIVSLGWVAPPVRYVETFVALSIAPAAWNLVRPMFAHGEVLLAGVFGLVHGMAFATTILEMNRAKNTSHLGTATGVQGHDEQLVQGFGRGTDPVGDIGEFQLAKEVEQGRLVKSHRVFVSFCE